jgi:multiple sugar transport system permease protein
MFSGSVQDITGIMRFPPRIIPKQVTMQNYGRILKDAPILRWIMNTVIIVSTGTVGCIIVSAMGGYYFARNKSKWARLFYGLILLTLMIPKQAIIVPLFVTTVRIGLPALISAMLPVVYSPIGVIFYKTFIESLPVELEEVARLDGASTMRILWSVYLPMSAPVTGTVAIWTGVALTTDYIWQNLLFRQPNEMPLIVGILGQAFKQSSAYMVNPIGMKLAAGVVMFVPLFLIFVFAQKYFTEGIQTGSLR